MRRFSFALLVLAAIVQAGCTGSTGNSSKTSSNTSAPVLGNPPAATVAVVVSPAMANVRAGAVQQFSAAVTGSSNVAVSWQVNGVAGGSAATGMVSVSGAYTAPSSLPAANSVTVTAVSAASASATSSSAVTLLNPVPALTVISPQTTPAGNFAITVTGNGFVSGAQVLLAGSALATSFVSRTQLNVSGYAASAGSFAITVMNPNPGSSVSSALSLQVTSTTSGTPPPPPPTPSVCSGMTVGQGGSLNGFVPFPAGSLWNQDISAAAVDSNSAALISFIGSSIGLHPDFGAGLYQGESMGIPYTVVGASQGLTPVVFTAYGDESDPGPMPIPLNAPIEGYPAPSGDRHVLVLDNSNCWLYELYNSSTGSTSWSADSAAVWDLSTNEQRPYTWTSADAAGLPIFPGLARYDEVAAGQIKHALRFTLQSSRAAFVPPATHWASNSGNANAAPMGMRLRLKASFNISTFSAANQVILSALKKYGMIMADNGSSMYISGAPDDRWNNDDLHLLGNVTAADFDVVQMSPVYTSANVPTGPAPVISSFTASLQSVSAGTPVTLSWNATGASYFIVSPEIGAVRGASVTVSPSQSTTYTLYATNAFGRTTATINITVH